MTLRNARNIVLSTRSGIRNGYQAFRKRIWESYGVKVVISTADITTKGGVKQLLKEANNLGPVSSIFNLALVSINDYNIKYLGSFVTFHYFNHS